VSHELNEAAAFAWRDLDGMNLTIPLKCAAQQQPAPQEYKQLDPIGL